MLEHSCSNTIPALEKTTTTAKPRHFLSLSLSLSLEQKASDTKGMCSRGGFGCTTNGEKKKKREREREREGEGSIQTIFFPISFCVSLSLSLEFRVTNTLDPQKKRRKIFCVSPHNSERTPLTPTPLCCGGFVFCVVQTTLAKERERERRSREEEETLDVRIQNCVVVGKRTLVMMGLDYWKILSR